VNLSIADAAREGGVAVIANDRAYTYAECAGAELHRTISSSASHQSSRTRAVWIAEPRVATICAIYQALEAHQPLALIHPALPEATRREQQRAFEAATLPPDTAFVLFTSGTTGTSRGVVLSRSAIIAAARASEARFGWRDDDRWLLALPMAHAGGLSIVIRCLLARKPIVIHQGDARLTAKATLASLVPAQLTEMHRGSPGPLRAVVLGGAAAMPTLVEAAVAAGWPIYPSYGLTETFGQIATATYPGGPLELLPGVEVDVRDTIAIRAPQLATCYLDGTAIAPELVTSDLGRLDGTVLRILGRRDEMINTGGEKVHPLDVERVLTATPGIRAAVVFGHPDERFGHVVAAVVVGDFDLAAAQQLWRAQLPSYARPRQLLRVDALPLLPSGKPDRRLIATLPVEPISADLT
jgi:O-succinylbenzoic acid--CoA ligase